MVSIKFLALLLALNVSLTIFTLLCVPVHRSHVVTFFSRTGTSDQHTERSTRVEWRSSRGYEQLGYIAAVQCLSTMPSKLGLNTSLYDDFAYVHLHAGVKTHKTAAFLPWHRGFLRIFETSLREVCGYRGPLLYWDWDLDWEAPGSSPIWDATYGIGGDGNAELNETIRFGRCVTEGPFKSLRPSYSDHGHSPHCLSRYFRDPYDYTAGLNHTMYPRESVEIALNQPSYEDFCEFVESSLHNAVHRSIDGDFGMLTSPNDPLFFLHHAQIDRLWWKWQQNDPIHRVWEYSGPADGQGETKCSLDDSLSYMGLGEDMKVSSVMDTEDGRSMYRY